MSISVEQINDSKQISVEGMLPAIAHRWSPRSFKETPVSAHDIKIILEAARWTASSSNLQPWRFFVGIKGSETHRKIFETLMPANQPWAGKPHILLLGFAYTKDAKGNTNNYALHDLGQALSALVLQAIALGLATHSMAGFHHHAARHAFNIPEDYALGAVTAIGYQDSPDTLPNDQLREREVAPRHRKLLSEIALIELDKPFAIE